MPRATTKKNNKTYLRTCMACGGEHETHKPKAKRCQGCIEAGRPQKISTCPSCEADFPAAHGGIMCQSCEGDPQKLEDYHRRQSDMLMERMQRDLEVQLEKELEQDAEDRRIRRHEQRKRYVALQLEFLERRGKKPKGYPEMPKAIAESTIGVLWLNLCATEGAVNCLLNDREVDDETKNRLLTTFLRLRLKGFTSEAVSKINPVALMGRDVAEVDRAITDLPKVEEDDEDEDEDFTFDPFEDLDENMRDEIIAFEERQKQREMEQRLGLRAS